MSGESDHFHNLNEELIVVKEQSAVAVYFNVSGGITIRKQRDWNEDEDTFIITTTPQAAIAVADAIYAEVEANCPESDALAPWRKNEAEPKDRTASERQRRRRDKQRTNGVTVTADVTAADRDEDRDTRDVTLFESRNAGVTARAA